MTWWASHGICIGLARCGMVYVIVMRMAWYMVWPVGHDIVYRMTWRGIARHMVWPRGHGMVYGMAWRGLAWYMIRHAGHNMAYGMAWRDMALYMISPGRRGMVYGVAWRGVAWYIVWPSGHGTVYDKAWRGVAWYVEMLMWISCLMTLPWAMVQFTWREADVSWRSCSRVQVPFTRTVTCMFRSPVQLLITLGSNSKMRDCEYIYIYISLFWDRSIDSHSYCVLSVDQAFCESLYLSHHRVRASTDYTRFEHKLTNIYRKPIRSFQWKFSSSRKPLFQPYLESAAKSRPLNG